MIAAIHTLADRPGVKLIPTGLPEASGELPPGCAPDHSIARFTSMELLCLFARKVSHQSIGVLCLNVISPDHVNGL